MVGSIFFDVTPTSGDDWFRDWWLSGPNTTYRPYSNSWTEKDIAVRPLINKQRKNPFLKIGPQPIRSFKSRPYQKKESFKKASNKVISRVGTI